MRGRRTGLRYACAPVLVAAIAAALLIGTPATSAPLANCTDSQLVPRVAELLVSQGLSQGALGYVRLARNKETIVRAYLTNPTTCTVGNRQSITPVSATLDVANGDTPQPAQLTNYQPLSGKLGATTQIYSTSDPFFVVPASYLKPTTTTGPFNIIFTLTIRYVRNGVTTTTYTANATTGPKPVDQRTNALRVLVVPMGDPTSTSTQWSPAAATALQNAMTAAARAFPVPEGISSSLCDTASTTCPLPGAGGIRYVVSTALLDVASLKLYTNTKFCANGSNWNNTSLVTSGPYLGHTLKGDLLQRLADYNLRNTPPADIVLGVVDGAIAWKSTGDPVTGCDDGRAATPASRAAGQVAWVRVDPSSYPSASFYPTPVQMELMHPFGVSDVSLTFHTSNVQADGGTSKGYNLLQRKVVATVTGALGTDDHSIMNYNTTIIPYTNDNTLLEPNDWGDALCDLGGVDSATATNCTLSTALGTSQGVPAAPTAEDTMYQISGVLSGSNVRVTDGKVAFGDVDVPIGVADSSLLELRFYSDCAGSSFLQAFPIAILGGEGHTNVANDVAQESADSFGALVPLPAGANRVELRLNGNPISPTPFNPSSCDAAPQVTSTSTVATGTLLADFTMPKSNGRAVAFDGNSTLYTTFVGDDRIFKFTTGGVASGEVSVGVQLGALTALKPDGNFYGGNYTGTGEIYDINPGNGAKSTVFTYNPDPPPECFLSEEFELWKFIDGLERLPSGNVAISGDRCKSVDIFDPSTSPTWTKVSSFSTPEGEDNSGITTDGADGLWLALNTGSLTRLAHRNATGTYTDSISTGRFIEDLAFDAKTFAPNCAVWGMSIEGPAHLLAYAVPCPSGTTQQAAAVQTQNADSVTLFFTCGSATNLEDEKFPLAVGLRPDAGGEVVAAYTNQLFCGVGSPKILSEASNGWTSTGLSESETQAATVSATSKAPRVNIAAPLNGAKFRRGETVHYEGGASDAEESAITGAGLQWTDDKLGNIGSGQSFDLKIPANAPLGDHKITLTATDAQNNSASIFVTINVGPALCPSTSKCP